VLKRAGAQTNDWAKVRDLLFPDQEPQQRAGDVLDRSQRRHDAGRLRAYVVKDSKPEYEKKVVPDKSLLPSG
jgi:hypothetical protein